MSWLVCGVCLIDSLIAPNDYAGDAYRRQFSMEIQALRPILVNADPAQVQKIIFPMSYRERIPDSFYKLGPKFEFVDMEPKGAEPPVHQQIQKQLRDRLAREPGTRMYIPRQRSTAGLVWTAYGAGGYKSVYERDATVDHFIEPADSEQLEFEFVRIPGTAFRQWLQAAGIRTQGVHVAWLVRGKPPGAPDAGLRGAGARGTHGLFSIRRNRAAKGYRSERQGSHPCVFSDLRSSVFICGYLVLWSQASLGTASLRSYACQCAH